MQVEVWMDVVCPWCYIGRRRFEKALAQREAGSQVEVIFRSYELDPHAVYEPTFTISELLATKYRMSPTEALHANERVSKIAADEGLEFHLDRARPTNTLDAHRVLQLAQVRRIRPTVEERFQRAYFTEGASLSDSATLLQLATEAGLSDSDVRRVLAGQAFTLQVRADEKKASALGATGVPFFVFDGRQAIFGAQPTDVFVHALESSGGPSGPPTS
jgi:predicted DsbA family dithiol-disulfide isomerase